MAQFTEAQLLELESIYGLKRKNILPVKDGVIKKGEMVWWRSEEGPQHVVAEDAEGVWDNIKAYPRVYSLAKPIVSTKVVYAD